MDCITVNSEKIRELIDANDITQGELAAAVERTPAALSRLMTGDAVSIETCMRIAKVFQVDADIIFTHTWKPTHYWVKRATPA